MQHKFWRLLAVFTLIPAFITPAPALADPVSVIEPTVELCTQSGVIMGTEGDDVLAGTDGDDIICAGTGDDKVFGGGGDDVIFGGDGNDNLIGESGDDKLVGGVGDDILGGGTEIDNLWGDSGDDELSGESGNDYISGGTGADNLFGGLGIDSLLAGLGNDGLDGGEGSDWLSGEGGSDTCNRDGADTVKLCFYDKRAPIITQIAVDPNSASIDVSGGSAVVTIRFVMSDPGSGADQVELWFEPKVTRKKGQGNEFYTFALNADVLCSDLLASNPNRVPTNCRLSGNSSRGVYTASTVVKGNARKGFWTFSGGLFRDKALNQGEWSYKDVDKRGLAVSFNQTGTPDLSSPQITSMAYVGSRTFTAEDTTLWMSVGFKDPNGLGLVSVHYERNFDATFSLAAPSISEAIRLNSISQCDDAAQYRVACIRSGDLREGVIEFPVRIISVIYPAVRLKPLEVEFQDLLGNARHLEVKSKASIDALTITKNFVTPRPVDDRDVKAPTVSSWSISKKKIDTASGEASFRITLKVKDSGIGLNMIAPNINFNFQMEGEQIPVSLPTTHVSSSGSANNGTYVFEVAVPAHFRQGKILISGVYIQDASQRENYLEFGQAYLNQKRWQSYVVNG